MKRIIVFAAFLFTVNFASGQAAILVLIFGDKAASENFYFSLKGGINYSDLPGLEQSGFKPGVHFGLSNNLKINDQWDFVPEFMPLSWKGASELNVTPPGTPQLDSLKPVEVYLNRRLNYLDLPLLMRYKMKNKFRIEFGPQISFLTSAKDIYRATFVEEDDFSYTANRRDDLHKFDYGFVVAVGYALTDFNSGKGIEFYLRYQEGFRYISKISGENFHNRTFQLSVSFPFILPEENNTKN
jgi:hypothetical protein